MAGPLRLPLRLGQRVLQYELLTDTGPAGPIRCARSGCGCCCGHHFFHDGGDVGVGGAVVNDAGAKGEGAVDAGVGQVDAPAAEDLAQDRGVALIQLCLGSVLPAEAHRAELDRRQQLQRGLGRDEPCQQLRVVEVIADRGAELADAVIAQ